MLLWTQTTRSDTRCAKSNSCRDRTTVNCRSATNSFKVESSSNLWRISRNEVGSSRTKISGSWHKARASKTRWRWPSLMAEKGRSDKSEARTWARAWSTFSQSDLERTPMRPVYGYRPAAAISRQVISSGWWRSVMRTDIFCATALLSSLVRLWPSSSTTPPSKRSWRTMVFRIVDFPAPLGPIRVMISPRRRRRSMCWMRGLS